MGPNSHDLELAYCDVLAVMDHGHVLAVLVARCLVRLAKVVIDRTADGATAVVSRTTDDHSRSEKSSLTAVAPVPDVYVLNVEAGAQVDLPPLLCAVLCVRARVATPHWVAIAVYTSHSVATPADRGLCGRAPDRYINAVRAR